METAYGVAVVAPAMVLGRRRGAGFAAAGKDVMLDFHALFELYAATPGLVRSRTAT